MAANAEVVIFDEPFNFIDRESKEMLWNEILQTFSDRTLIVISHDPFPSKDCHRIVHLGARRKPRRMMNGMLCVYFSGSARGAPNRLFSAKLDIQRHPLYNSKEENMILCNGGFQMFKYTTSGTCSREILIETEGDTIKHIQFVGGCTGNTQGVARLAEGRKITEVIELCKGIQCRGNTSCPDQLARALEQILAQNA